jgi:N-acetylglutamate synthase-like GNAT family acetyltransferase
MRASPRKIRRRRRPGEVTIEQTHDAALVEAMLDRAAAGLALRCWSKSPRKIVEEGECFLIAYLGQDPVGIVGLQTRVDAALMDPIFVVDEVRHRAIGVGLVSAARRAAYGRGARILYTIVPHALANYFVRLGFAEATGAEFDEAFGHASNLHYKGLDRETCRPLRLDLSQDGLLAR